MAKKHSTKAGLVQLIYFGIFMTFTIVTSAIILYKKVKNKEVGPPSASNSMLPTALWSTQ